MITNIGEYVRVKGDPYPWKLIEYAANLNGEWYTVERRRKDTESSPISSLDDAFADMMDQPKTEMLTQRLRGSEIRPFVTLKKHQIALIEEIVTVTSIQKSHLGDVPVHQYVGRTSGGSEIYFTENQIVRSFEDGERVTYSHEKG